MSKPKKPQKQQSRYHEDSDPGSLKDFICDDDESAAEEGMRHIKKMFGDKKYKDYSSEESESALGMEAGFDSQEEEEEFSRRLAEQEDREELHRIAEDRHNEYLYRRERIRQLRK